MKFDAIMKALGIKKVTLILDNYPDHFLGPLASNDKLEVTKTFFLPPNMTTRLQPMDIRIIASFKCHYRKLYICKQLADFDANKLFKCNVYDAVIMNVVAHEEVIQKTIKNC